MQGLSTRQVALLHAELLDLHGGEPGVRDERALEAVADLDGLDTVAAQAAHYLHALVQWQPFHSANDRVGIACLLLWLRAHGHWDLPDYRIRWICCASPC